MGQAFIRDPALFVGWDHHDPKRRPGLLQHTDWASGQRRVRSVSEFEPKHRHMFTGLAPRIKLGILTNAAGVRSARRGAVGLQPSPIRSGGQR